MSTPLVAALAPARDEKSFFSYIVAVTQPVMARLIVDYLLSLTGGNAVRSVIHELHRTNARGGRGNKVPRGKLKVSELRKVSR